MSKFISYRFLFHHMLTPSSYLLQLPEHIPLHHSCLSVHCCITIVSPRTTAPQLFHRTQRYTDSLATDSSPTDSSPTDISSTGQFANSTVRRQDSSQTGRFATGQFTDRTFRRQDSSPTVLFADNRACR